MIGIYKVTNLVDGKIYIGQSRNIGQRWTKHRCSPFNVNSSQYDTPFYKAIRKYGIDNFQFEIIEQCSIDILNEREIFWIKFYDSNNLDKGYNLTSGGQNAITTPKLTYEEVTKIIDLLINSSLSQEEIGRMFNVSQRIISGINQGQNWVRENLVYPIRSASDIQKRQRQTEENRCLICGKIISKNAQYCRSCSNRNKQKFNISRQELKNLIRTTSFVEIGKKFNVSDNAIKKRCIAYNLPSKKRDIKKYSDEEWEKI
jgi:group I intron endonuclease